MIENKPKRLRIGHRFYSVCFQGVVYNEGVAVNGLCDFHSGTIYIDASLRPEVSAEILLHEAIHAMNLEGGIDDGACEEVVTTMTAKNLCRFIQDNPGAMRWIIKQLRKPKA